MTLPMDYNGVREGVESERTNNVDNYKITCMDFIKDISNDYIEWVNYYKLPLQEDKKRREEITATIKRTNDWIAKIPRSIKAVDVIMNDGIQKMAEATAGKPFQIGVFVNKKSGYVLAKPGIIDINVKSAGRKEKRSTKLDFHFKDTRFRIESTCGAYIDETKLPPTQDYPLMDINLKLYAQNGKSHDVISFTVIISELENGTEVDKRGVSTIICLT